MMGSLPLSVLNHDAPVDSRFISGLFNVYDVAIMSTPGIRLNVALLAALCFGLTRVSLSPSVRGTSWESARSLGDRCPPSRSPCGSPPRASFWHDEKGFTRYSPLSRDPVGDPR